MWCDYNAIGETILKKNVGTLQSWKKQRFSYYPHSANIA